MQQLLTVSLLLVMAISAGCAGSQGFDRVAMREALHVDPSDNQPPVNQQTRPSPPLRLGIFFANHDFSNRPAMRKVEWLSTDRDQLLRELAPLRNEQILSDAFVLLDVTLQSEDIRGIRQAGARHGADMILIVDGAAAVDRYNNRFAWLYPTIIGAYLAPGTESSGLVMATGILWAVRSEWHSPVLTIEGQSKLVGSTVFVEDTAALQEAKKIAIQTLGERIADQLQLLK